MDRGEGGRFGGVWGFRRFCLFFRAGRIVCVVGMGRKQVSRVFVFRKVGAPIVNVMDFANRAGSELRVVPAGATFVARRTERGLEQLFVTDDVPNQTGVAFNLARAVHGESVEVDEAPDLGEVAALYVLRFTGSSTLSAATQAGAEISTVAETLGASLRPGEWVAVSVRQPSNGERRRWRRWLERGLKIMTHPSLSAGAPVVQFWAGGGVDSAAQNLDRVVGVMAGLGLQAVPVRVSGWRLLRPVFAASGVLAAAGVAVMVAERLLPGVLPVGAPIGGVLLAAAVAAVVYGVGASGAVKSMVLPGPWRQLRWLLSAGRVPVAPRRFGTVKPPTPEQVKFDQEGNRMVVPEHPGEYPLAPAAFMVGAHHVLSIVVPHAGAFSAGGATASRTAPVEFTDPAAGPQIGESGGRPVFLSWRDLWAGTFLIGMPGSGKTALIEWLWAESLRQITEGHRVTPVAFDTKGDGEVSKQMVAWGVERGVPVREFHVADRSAGIAIDLFPRVGGAYSQARRIVDAFVYLYGDQAVGARSQDTLTRVFHAALLVDAVMCARLVAESGGVIQPGRSIFFYANILLGEAGDQYGQMLAGVIGEAASQPGASQELVEAFHGLAPLYGGGVTAARRRELTEAPRNKVAALTGMEHWWSAPTKIGWAELLSAHLPVVVNTGAAPNGDQPVDARTTEDMGALLLYSLQLAIREHCHGWQDAGRAVRVFSDEVKAVAAVSPQVVKWLRSDGRAFGVEAVMATQQPRQLHAEVRSEVMSFGNLVSFAQNDAATAEEIARDLSLDGSEWRAQDVANLAQFHAIVRATVGQVRVAPFTVRVPDFRAGRVAQPQAVGGGSQVVPLSDVARLLVDGDLSVTVGDDGSVVVESAARVSVRFTYLSATEILGVDRVVSLVRDRYGGLPEFHMLEVSQVDDLHRVVFTVTTDGARATYVVQMGTIAGLQCEWVGGITGTDVTELVAVCDRMRVVS